MATKETTRTSSRRARLQQARIAARNAERRRRLRLRIAAGVGVLAVAGLVTVGTLAANHRVGHSTGVSPSKVAALASGGGAGPLPWTNPADPIDAIKAAGLTPLTGEGTAEHYHAHLDVIVNGQPVPVAADVGVDDQSQRISALHTHDGSGVIHIEAPTVGTAFYLGQLFREWNVALAADRIGGLRTDATHSLTVYVNGKPVTGNPAQLRLAAHQEIAIVYGPTTEHVNVPTSYAFGDL